MSELRRDDLYLGDILEAIQRVLDYTRGLTYEDFLKHPMVQDAFLRNIQVIGEATKKLSDELRNSQLDIPWREMAGMRDKRSSMITSGSISRSCGMSSKMIYPRYSPS